ncbi:MAG: hypothetical protein LBR53_01515 [Deltaproteobacteria bacterium]|nr:hypothetical protein [Deltaproteobacteria bacterium]
MFFFKKKPDARELRLRKRKTEMDDFFHFRPFGVFDVEEEFAAEMGAFLEDAVLEDDFHHPMEDFLEELFHTEEDEI